MRLLLTGGGTGGHVYPALAVAEALRRDAEAGGFGATPASPCAAGPHELLYVGSQGGMEAGIVAQGGLPFRAILAGAVRGRSPFGLLVGAGRTAVGLLQALAIVGRYRPAAVLATGGYVCVPVVLAAWLRRVPVLMYLPDVEPGLAVSFLSRFAARVAVTSEGSRRFFAASKVVVTGYPVRPEVFEMDRARGRAHLGLPSDARVVLVFGGSRGARTLNEATAAALPRLLELAHVVHVCGREDESAARARLASLPSGLAERYHLYTYLHSTEMAAALAAADLAVSRAGASTLGEFPAVGLPSILVPYPHAGAHQRLNAEALASLGAAVVLDNAAVRAGALLPAVEQLLGDPDRLAGMAAAARSLARPDAALAIARVLCGLGRAPRSWVEEQAPVPPGSGATPRAPGCSSLPDQPGRGSADAE